MTISTNIGRHPNDIRLECAVCGMPPELVEYDNIFRATMLRVRCHGKREFVEITHKIIERVRQGETITVFALPEAPAAPKAPKNGCHNKPRDFAPIMVQDGWFPPTSADAQTRRPKMVKYAPRFEKACQYTHTTLGKNDTGCAGCVHRAES